MVGEKRQNISDISIHLSTGYIPHYIRGNVFSRLGPLGADHLSAFCVACVADRISSRNKLNSV